MAQRPTVRPRAGGPERECAFDTATRGMTDISLCMLCYGAEFGELARRCFGSLRAGASGASPVRDLRVGLNAVPAGSETHVAAVELAKHFAAAGKPASLFYPQPQELNVYKYPLMRRMFWEADEPLAEFVMWFDDDSYVSGDDSWWTSLPYRDVDMVGQKWFLPLQGNQWAWIKAQPWYDESVGLPGRVRGHSTFQFIQGAWWIARTSLLRRLNWPWPELRHCGGDSLLGEACRHARANRREWAEGVRINADAKGRHSGAARRGYSELELGRHFVAGQPLSTAHQDFAWCCERIEPQHAFPCSTSPRGPGRAS